MTYNRLRILGLNIKAERTRREISQEQLAEMIDVSRNTIILIETAKINPTIIKMVDIANALNIDIKELLRDV
ncbi:MAG: helix-turn-helix transcriptional regulator [Candidatus Gastranaerophilales bacterium]